MTTQKAPMRAVGDMDKGQTKRRSRNSDGNVPNSNWNDDQAKLNWNYSNNRNENLRGREEVSHKKSQTDSFYVKELIQLLFSLEISTACSDNCW